MVGLILTDEQLKAAREKISGFIRESVVRAKASGVVFGLSGGIDSAVVAVLAKESGVNTKALVMPYWTSNPEDAEDALALARKIGVDCKKIDIKPVVSAAVKQAGGVKDKKTIGNIHARARMTLLYAHANAENRLVLGTGNKTELLLGYFTKYGDGGVDILPIGGLYKTQVRALAEKTGVPEKIIKKIPTAGLWEGQTDEGELGLEYGRIDEILYLLYDAVVDEESAALESGVSVKKIAEISERVRKNSHKTRTPPVADLSEIIG